MRTTKCAKLVADHDSGAAGKNFSGPHASNVMIVAIPPIPR